MPLTAGPTQPDSVTTVAVSVATSEARKGMSYQRRVISGIFFTCRKRCRIGTQIAKLTTLAATPAGSDQCAAWITRASASQTKTAAAQLTSMLRCCASTT